jgi:alkylation response protein AidB-like acyl-CoA dehydrogenase
MTHALALDATPADRAFRAEARAWLAAHAEPRRGEGDWSNRPQHDSEEAEREYFERCRAWQRTLFDGGWAGISWPVEFGGRGGTPWQAVIFDQEQARFDVTSGFLGSTIGMVGPVLMASGTDEQRARFLGPLLRGDEAWCQLFSEPGAGSDLANLATRAERDGDEFVVNGQKVWTSNAHRCDWAILLARTNPDAPKHRGITFFLLDLRTPGVDIRPLRQITGTAHFNEVFLTDVRVPVTNVVGEVDRGWEPSRRVLGHEAAVIGGARTADSADALIDLARSLEESDAPLVRQRLARAYAQERVLDHLRNRVLESVREGRPPALDGSVLKILWSEARAERGGVGVDLLGPAGALSGADAPRGGHWQVQLLNRFWGTIGGGTSEVHRTMIGERVLGLPPEPRVDRDVAWNADRSRA